MEGRRPSALAAIAIAAITASGGARASDLGFGPPVPLVPEAIGGLASVTADFDGDGLDDVLALPRQSVPSHGGRLLLYRQRGDGSFDPPQAIDFRASGAGAHEPMLRAGDIDGDGDTDAVLYGRGSPGALLAFVNANGTLAYAARSDAADWFMRMALFDATGDGIPDIAGTAGIGEAFVHAGDGTGSFGPPIRAWTGSWGSRIDFADVDGDDRTDMVYNGDGAIRFQRNLPGTGLSPTPEWLLAVPWEVYGSTIPAVADVDGDGRPDLVFAVANQRRNLVAVYFQDAGGGFRRKALSATPESGLSFPRAFAADLDGDGAAEVITTAGSGFTLRAWRNGRLTAPQHLPLPAPTDPRFADLDGDGSIDILPQAAATFYLPGGVVADRADLAVSLAAEPGVLVVRVANATTVASAGHDLRLDVSARTGGIALGPLPPGCSAEGGGRARCYARPGLPAQSATELRFPITATPAPGPGLATASARISPAGADRRAGNDHQLIRFAPASAARSP